MPGLSGPGVRVYPFTHVQLGYGFLLERDGGKDRLFLAPEPTTPNETITAFIAAWLHLNPGKPFPFVYLVRDDDAVSVAAFDGLRQYWRRKYPRDELPLFSSNSTEAEILEAVDDVIANWAEEHAGAPYPRSIEAATEH